MALLLANMRGGGRMFLSMLRGLACVPNRQSHLIPPSQYDTPLSNKFRLGYTLRHHWEIIPLYLTTLTSIGILFYAVVWSAKNKVDVVYKTHSRDTISRTMDLRCPTIHKLITINQDYRPWPSMQDALDKCCSKEKALACKRERKMAENEAKKYMKKH